MVVEHYNQKRTFVGSTLENFKQMREMQRRTKRIIFLPTFCLLFRHKQKKSYICTTIKNHKITKTKRLVLWKNKWINDVNKSTMVHLYFIIWLGNTHLKVGVLQYAAAVSIVVKPSFRSRRKISRVKQLLH